MAMRCGWWARRWIARLSSDCKQTAFTPSISANCRKRLPHYAVQPVLPDGAGAGWETVPAFEQVELHVITTKTQTPRVLFRSFGGVELVVTARDVQHGGTYAAGVRIVPIAGHRAAEGGHAADGIRVRPGKAIVERHGLGEA